jgi:hypothetical protein
MSGYRRTVTRDGYGQPTVTEAAFSFTGHHFPAGPISDRMEPGGHVIGASYTILTDDTLQVADEAAGTVGDDIVIGGRRYRVISLADRGDHPIPMLRHRAYTAAYVREGEDG